ncbi:hypothetical protein TRIATDRAFT_86533 [Trichoderma atroviride IMI 206040]|uniref:HNH nuclease domain-containing protein n=1 Tax=Hypocrea atroviridis (strain ATCC 20476 / IMI 206040) TaxID=452589 RepID=G9P1U2_HYPAI|nr:uncharacterized protein TRIATDRAFT_86533 [Trichoderma atroviride IMI 206040]EHK42591.1 hypothetical protein TRIATDRAFT_86533 [Trichoderma atroviride IMI 206040]
MSRNNEHSNGFELAEAPQRVRGAFERLHDAERNSSQLRNLTTNALSPPTMQQTAREDRDAVESIIEATLQAKEKELAAAEDIVAILNEERHVGSLNVTQNGLQSEVDRLERLITALKGDSLVIRTSRHELSGKMLDNMMWPQDGARLALFSPRDPSAHERFRNKVLKAYDAVDEDMQWCVISGKYLPASTVRAAHIVGYNVGEPSARHLFGPPGNKNGHLMSDHNGIPMYEMYEKAFNDARLVILPDSDPKKGCWKVYCLDDPDTHKPSKAVPFGRELHGRSLQFRNNFRPSSRYLYFAFCMSILRRQRHEVPGWWRDRLVDGLGKVWATPGTYLRTLTLRSIAHQVGHLTKEEAAVFTADAAEDEGEDDCLHSKLIGCAYALQNSTMSWNGTLAQTDGTESSEEEDDEDNEESWIEEE